MQAKQGATGIAPAHSQPATLWPVCLREGAGAVVQDSGWVSGPVKMAGKISLAPRFDPRTVQTVKTAF